jgi:hypothetical protein
VQLTERTRLVVADLGGSDRRGARRQIVVRRRGPADCVGDLTLTVAAYPPHRTAQRLQASKRRAGKRARNGIAPDDHDIGIRRARIGEHSLERVDVAVDVIQREDVQRRRC